VLEQLQDGSEVVGGRHRFLAFSAVAARHPMTERRYRVTKIPPPGEKIAGVTAMSGFGDHLEHSWDP
jgi:hypothetical protein